MLPVDQSKYISTLVTLGKQANTSQHEDWLKDVLDKALTHHTTAGLLGAGAGATTGAIAGKKGHKLKSMLAGAGIGAGAGVGASFAAPELSKDTNEQLVKHLIRRPLGRVMTNLVEPIGYNFQNDQENLIKKTPLKDLITHVLADKPLYKDNPYFPREAIYRDSFDLPPRWDTPDTADSVYHKVKDKVWEFKEPEHKKVHVDSPKENIMRDAAVMLNYGNKEHASFQGDTVMGGYNLDKGNDGLYHYKDKWDFDLHKDEHIVDGGKIKGTNLIRYLVNKIISPVVMEGAVPPYPNAYKST